MGIIYRNKKPIPIPPNGRINKYDKCVSRYYRASDGSRRRNVIGVMVDENTMLPNDNFRKFYPKLWDEYYGEDTPSQRLIRTGMYALCLGIGEKTTIYKILQDSFGPHYANAIMDFAMYSIHDRTNVAQLMSESMIEQMLFSIKRHSDSWYSTFFSKDMSLDAAHKFRTQWLDYHKEHNKLESVWLCIDGSNNDNAVKNSDLSEVGHAKSHRETEIVSYMWAVDARDGRPITYFVNNGSMPDCKAVDEVIKFLGSSHVSIKGVILDRGFVSQDVLRVLKERNLDYIIMLKSNNYGYTDMLSRHAKNVMWKATMAVDDDALFGTIDNAKIFASSEEESCVALYFSPMAQTLRGRDIIKKVRQGYRALKQRLEKKPNDLSVPKELKHYLIIEKDDKGKPQVKYNYENFQKALDSNGFFAIASGSKRTAEEIHKLYQLRDHSEKQFSEFKSQLGFDTTRVHSDIAIENRLTVGFIAAVIRTEIQLACKELGLDDVNLMIRKLDRIYTLRSNTGEYEYADHLSRDLESLLEHFGFTSAHLEKLTEEINIQEQGNYYKEIRKIPDITPRTAGRPKGSKNKDTAPKEEDGKKTEEQKKEPRPAGRPKGSKNKATLEKERKIQDAKDKGEYVETEKRGRGRPKGSKNKKTLEREAKLKAQQEKRGRGRPAGSKNKKTLEREAQMKKNAQKPKKKDRNTAQSESQNKAQIDPKVGGSDGTG